MTGDDLKSMIQGFAQAPGEHQVEDFVHLPCEHWSNGSGEHGQALEDGCLDRCVLLAVVRVRQGIGLVSSLTLSDVDDPSRL
jgi:hypothetical protein